MCHQEPHQWSPDNLSKFRAHSTLSGKLIILALDICNFLLIKLFSRVPLFLTTSRAIFFGSSLPLRAIENIALWVHSKVITLFAEAFSRLTDCWSFFLLFLSDILYSCVNCLITSYYPKPGMLCQNSLLHLSVSRVKLKVIRETSFSTTSLPA